MADWLVIRMQHVASAPASWVVADSGGRIVTAPQSGTLTQAAAFAGGRRVCVLVPASDVLFTEADVPLKAGTKIHQVVPFALEEQLAEDIETLHFAIGRRSPESSRTPVAVVSRSLMDEWSAMLHVAALHAEVMYCESSLIPENPGQAVALLDADSVVVRPAGGAQVAMPLDALTEALELVRPASPDVLSATEPTASGLILYTGASEWHQYSPVVESVRDRFDGIKVQLLTDGPLALFAQQLPAAAAHAINLLQGPYAPTDALATGWRGWRVAAILLVSLIGLHVAGAGAQLIALHRAEHKLDTSIEETFRAAMPGEHNATNARRRMEQRLIGVQGGDGSGLLAALGALAQARNGVSGAVLQALSFREGALELKLTAPNAEALDHMSQLLRANGWQADLTAGNAVGSRYEGRIQIKPRA
jgi:general secretion pathway protein L